MRYLRYDIRFKSRRNIVAGEIESPLIRPVATLLPSDSGMHAPWISGSASRRALRSSRMAQKIEVFLTFPSLFHILRILMFSYTGLSRKKLMFAHVSKR